MSPLRLLDRVNRTKAGVQLWIIRRPFTAGTIAAFTTGSIAALGNFKSGFRWKGVRRDSRAAAWQARRGNVEPRSTFSTLQSAGMGGSGAFIVYGIPAAGVALITIILGLRMRNREAIRRLRRKLSSNSGSRGPFRR